jgi:tagatose 1,6-diphosphate aldolase
MRRRSPTRGLPRPGRLVDGELELVLAQERPATGETVPGYQFDLCVAGVDEPVGQVELRVGEGEALRLYAGHVGYRVAEAHRGHRYAARAVRLLLPLARANGLQTLWITANPDNAASRRTCEILGAELVGTVDLPPSSELYRRGERRKCRYRLDLEGGAESARVATPS